MFPSISAEDFQKLLQKIVVLETELFRLKMNMEVNLQYGMNDTTLPQTLGSGQDSANKRLSNVNTTPGKDSRVDKPVSWDVFGAKPKLGTERITGRTLCPEITDMAAWPTLPARPRHSAASTPLQQWTTVKGKRAKAKTRIEDIHPKKGNVLPGNRFAALLADANPTSSSDVRGDTSSSPSRVRRTQRNSVEFVMTEKKQQQLIDDHFLPEILIVGDASLQDVKSMRKRSAKVICFPNLMVSDMNDRIVDLVAAHPTVKTLILHIGTCDTKKGQSEILKQHFKALFITLSRLRVDVYISGPLPPVPRRGGTMNFSRLYSLSEWLLTTCTEKSVHFIDNFNFLWDRQHLFRDGIRLNRAGVKQFLSNLFYCVESSAPVRTQESKIKDNGPAKDTIPPVSEGGIITSAGVMKTTELKRDNADSASSGGSQTFSGPFQVEMPPSGGEVETATGGDQDETAPPSNGEEANCNNNRETATESATDGVGEMPINEEELQSSSPCSLSMSPIALLEFTNGMNDFVNAGTKLTPLMKRQAPPPPCKESGPPPIPLRRHYRNQSSVAPQSTCPMSNSLENTFNH